MSTLGALWPSDGPALVGVGIGPGDPSLVTLRAVQALQTADVVIAPTTAENAEGRAEAIARGAVPELVCERVVFVMEVDTEARHDALAAVVDKVVAHLDVGHRVAFVTLGDPNVYSTFSSVAEGVTAQRPDAPVSTVPGIMAFQELAARSSTVLVDGHESLVLVPAHITLGGVIQEALQDPDVALVVYKGGRRIADLAEQAADAERLDGAVLGELLGLPGERIGPLAEAVEDGRRASYLSTAIFPPPRRAGADPS
ncbi:precorrin-2 C(20)-methyltransferase [soil metagenome]